MNNFVADDDSCDARQSLLESPTGPRIEAHATELLSRTLALRPPIAFVGAGASMAYGRISWRDAVIAMQDQVLATIQNPADLDPVGQRIHAQLKAVQIEPGRQTDSGDYLIVFQLTEQLEAATRSHDAQEDGFRKKLSLLLSDELGHAQHIADVACRHLRCDKLKLREKVWKDHEEHHDFRSRPFFTILKSEIAPLLDNRRSSQILEALSEFADAPSTSDLMLPFYRFAIGAAIQMLPPGTALKSLGLANLPPNLNSEEYYTIPVERDPLRLLRRCDITRFLTTNYDHEIDRCLKREGLLNEQQPVESGKTYDRMGKHWRSLVFDRFHVGQMIAFAARDGRQLVEVAHLHGRADAPEGLIVTNEDYQRHYLSIDDQRAGMDEALSAALSGNAILFVGSGMGEDDLLRPLRQFIGDHVPGSRRVAIAIVPADKGDSDRVADLEKLRNFQRYGVYTIHTGHAQFSPIESAPSNGIPSRWLTRIAELRRKLDSMLDAPDPEAFLSIAIDICKWVAVALGSRPMARPVSLEEVKISENPALGLERELGLFDLLVTFANEAAEGAALEIHRQLAPLRGALRFALEGCMDSINGAFLCARLIQMDSEESEAIRDWMQLPKAEDPAATIRATFNTIRDRWKLGTTPRWNSADALWIRHAIAHAPHPSESAGSHQGLRFYTGAPSQTFNHLLLCLNPPLKEDRQTFSLPPLGRRVFLFISRRGTGKGHFFAALSGQARLEELRISLGNDVSNDPKTRTHRWPAVFFNCGLSHEVTSIFDQLSELLLQAVQRIYDDWDVTVDDQKPLQKLMVEASALSKNRIGRLKHVIEQIGKCNLLKAGQRIIVGISGLSVLFDAEGKAKNAAAARLFDLLLSDSAASTPLDIVLVSGERRLPQRFRSATGLQTPRDGADSIPFWLYELPQDSLSLRESLVLAGRRRRVAITAEHSAVDGPYRLEIPARPQGYVHFLAQTRASIMGTAYFPAVSLVIALQAAMECFSESERKRIGPQRHGNCLTEANAAQFLASRDREIQALVAKLLDTAATQFAPHTVNPRVPKQAFPKLLAHAALWSAAGQLWDEGISSKPPSENYDFALPQVDSSLLEQLPYRMEELRALIDKRFRALFLACGRSRFGFTVLMATAYQLLSPVTNGSDPGSTQVGVALKHCVEFMRVTQLKLESVNEERRVETILDIAMAKLAQIDGDSLPLSANLDRLKPNRQLYELQRAIIWQLSIIGQPVILDVVARSPLVTRFFNVSKEWQTRKGEETSDQAWLELVRQCLELLQQRCLVFCVRPRVAGREGAQGELSYVVHSQLQLHVFHTLHAPFMEYPEADQYAVTLFASQPNDMPRLTGDAMADLYSSVSAMIGYPDTFLRAEPKALPSWPRLATLRENDAGTDGEAAAREFAEQLRIRAQMLRAALGIVRSVYSFSTIVRTVTDRPRELHPGGAHRAVQRARLMDTGLLERHRGLIYWMIRQATRHDRHVDLLNRRFPQCCAAPADSPFSAILRPFYAEEIAWLYNEAGIFSYAQGRMLDARVFYSRAIEAAKELEPDSAGGIRVRIALNCALADIERGRLSPAEAALSEVLRIEDEHPAVLRIASGLMGLLEHLRGRYTPAEAHYKDALDDRPRPGGTQHLGLISLKKTRAASIVSRHYGDMLRMQHRYPEARRLLMQSATLAIDGGHEDIRHQARLASLNLELTEAGIENEVRPSVDGSRIHKELDVVEDYANHMGMPRLQCDIDLIRAQLRQADGDLQAAASVASRGLTIATANDLRLRKTRFLLRLAEIFSRRGKVSECAAVLAEAFNIARECEYHSAREQGQALFARINRRHQLP